jgi:hypothetical protein
VHAFVLQTLIYGMSTDPEGTSLLEVMLPPQARDREPAEMCVSDADEGSVSACRSTSSRSTMVPPAQSR